MKGYLADGTVEINQQRELIIEKISSNEEKMNEDTFENEEDEDDEVKYLIWWLKINLLFVKEKFPFKIGGCRNDGIRIG